MLGKTALITGAYGGLGEEVSIELAKNDCNLFLVGRDSLKIRNLTKEIKSYDYGVNIQGKAVDLSKDSDVKALLNVLLNNDIHIDILINNAAKDPKPKKGDALSPASRFETMTEKFWQDGIDACINGTFLCSQV